MYNIMYGEEKKKEMHTITKISSQLWTMVDGALWEQNDATRH